MILHENIQLTDHFRARMKRRRITADEVAAALARPAVKIVERKKGMAAVHESDGVMVVRGLSNDVLITCARIGKKPRGATPHSRNGDKGAAAKRRAKLSAAPWDEDWSERT